MMYQCTTNSYDVPLIGNRRRSASTFNNNWAPNEKPLTLRAEGTKAKPSKRTNNTDSSDISSVTRHSYNTYCYSIYLRISFIAAWPIIVILIIIITIITIITRRRTYNIFHIRAFATASYAKLSMSSENSVTAKHDLDGSYLHLSRLQRVVETGPCLPIDAVTL